jgi:hypothetical protein
MSAALDILKRAKLAGITLAADGYQLRLKAPKEPPPELIAELRAHKAELLALLAASTTDAMKTWVQPSPLPHSPQEAAERIAPWLQEIDRLPKACSPQGARLRALTSDFALGPWASPCVQSGWSDTQLFALDGGLIPEMSRRPLHFRSIAAEMIVFVNGKGMLEARWSQDIQDSAGPWWIIPS